jgi:glutaredoxin
MSVLRVVFLTTALLTAVAAGAQTTYRWVDKATGKTVFSDQQPPPSAVQVVKKDGSERGDEPQLPFATRQAAAKFPVTLYTVASCADECKQARDMLNGRGVPFTEKMLKSEAEFAELKQKLGSEAAVPSLTVGQQAFKGYENGAWNNLLDLAGYPKSAAYGSKPSGAFAQ